MPTFDHLVVGRVFDPPRHRVRPATRSFTEKLAVFHPPIWMYAMPFNVPCPQSPRPGVHVPRANDDVLIMKRREHLPHHPHEAGLTAGRDRHRAEPILQRVPIDMLVIEVRVLPAEGVPQRIELRREVGAWRRRGGRRLGAAHDPSVTRASVRATNRAHPCCESSDMSLGLYTSAMQLLRPRARVRSAQERRESRGSRIAVV